MTEAPAFKTAVMYKNMTVVVPPQGVRLSPRLPALARYAPGETVERNCSAGGSVPRTVLKWIINGKPATVSELVEYPDVVDKDGRVTSTSGVRLVTNQHFLRGIARVSCLASINGQKLTTLSEVLHADKTATVAYNTHLSNAVPEIQSLQNHLLLITSLMLEWRRPRN
ncbi:uncharacterized protein LOC108671944 [Hyalella azteca]|uniref:Uncharacterized protein LOC108671944 n=1 Tax=Hyalella azteca TaxID=294128 RepID=A0A8B7NMW7_HYAAZ|nr:uncharacterized protein LOC108671944 [Hyalella azteca]